MSSKKTTTPKARRRDNFGQAVIQILYKRAGGKCCRCFAPTFGPVSNNPNKSVNIGQGAHIAAAAPGGPRYDPKMKPEERASATNGMWMCSNCHDIIDRDVEEFPTARLKTMKKNAEKRAKEEMGVGTSTEVSEPRSSLSVGVSAMTIVEIRKAKAVILALNGKTISQAQGEELLASVSFINPEVDNYLPEVGTEMTAYFDQLIAHCAVPIVVLEVLRRLSILADKFNTQWTKDDVEQISRVGERVLTKAKSKRTSIYQSGAALLKDLSKYPALKEKGLYKIPANCLKELRSVDLTDGGPPEPKKMRVDDSDEGDEAGGPPPLGGSDDDRYLQLMEQLSVCEDPKQVEKIEEELATMGFEPNIM